jgi:hypothetical protein
MSVMENQEELKEYVGVIWLGDEPGRRISVWAVSASAAVEKVEDEFGEGHVYTIRNLKDAHTPRGE